MGDQERDGQRKTGAALPKEGQKGFVAEEGKKMVNSVKCC